MGETPLIGSIILPRVLVELCVAKKDVRDHLRYPYLDLRESEHPMLVATDGHKLIAAPVEVDGTLESCSIPLEAIALARKSADCKLIFNGEMCGTLDVMYRRPSNNYPYPEWRKVAKDAPRGKPTIALNASYLDTFSKALSGDLNKGITLTFDSPNSVVRVRALSHDLSEDGTIALVMPMAL